jgi:hypothetical protein
LAAQQLQHRAGSNGQAQGCQRGWCLLAGAVADEDRGIPVLGRQLQATDGARLDPSGRVPDDHGAAQPALERLLCRPQGLLGLANDQQLFQCQAGLLQALGAGNQGWCGQNHRALLPGLFGQQRQQQFELAAGQVGRQEFDQATLGPAAVGQPGIQGGPAAGQNPSGRALSPAPQVGA